MNERRGARCARWVMAVLSLASVSAARAIDLEGVQIGALDQPQINTIVRLTGFDAPPQSSTFEDPFSGETVTYYNLNAYFDTGASGILFSSATAEAFGVQPSTAQGMPVYFNDVGSTGSATFEVSQPIYLQFAPYSPNTVVDVPGHFADYTHALGPVRVQVGPVQNDLQDPLDAFLASFSSVDVVGMPAMKGKVVVVDPRRADNFDLDAIVDAILESGDLTDIELPDVELRTYLYDKSPANAFHPATVDTNPGIPTTNRHVALSMSSFSTFTSTTPSGSAGPDLAENPFIGRDPVQVAHEATHGLPAAAGPKGIKVTLGDKSSEGNWLLDSGAAASIISTAQAAKLGITVGHETSTDPFTGETVDTPYLMLNGMRLPDDQQFQLPLSGVSGASTMAGFYLDSLLLRTTEGDAANDDDPNHIRFLHAPVLVGDITLTGQDPLDPTQALTITLDGVFGMNYMVASADFSGDLFSIGGTVPGAFDWLTFDFSDMNNPLLGLNLKAELLGAPEPASVALLAPGVVLLLRRRRR